MNFHPTAPLDCQRHDPAAVFAAGLRLHHIANTAYPIGHVATMRPYRVHNSAVQNTAPLAWEGVNRLGLYVHVPFCEARCGYCEYTVLDPSTNTASETTYFDLLMREFELWGQAIDSQAKTLVGFDIGGGTPSVADEGQIARVVEVARRHFHLPPDVDISIETTPRIAARSPEKIRAYRQMGIRRISMGVQTVNPLLLADVGRPHTSLEWNFTAAENIRAAGFEKFNVDVMYGFAGQQLDSIAATLNHVIRLNPEYVTLYRMRYKGTRIAERASLVTLPEVNQQAALAKEMLRAAGYHANAGKNTFSRLAGDPGTSDYLTGRVVDGTPYLGLGLGAQSLSEVTLAYNSGAADKRLDHYRRQLETDRLPIQDLYHLSPEAAMGKMISVSFYFGEIDLAAFTRKFGLLLEKAFPEEVAFVLREGLMEMTADRRPSSADGDKHPTTLRLTEAGEKVYNGVIALFYAGAVKAHLLEKTAFNVKR